MTTDIRVSKAVEHIFSCLDTNFNFRVIAKLNKKYRIFIAELINSKGWEGESHLFV